MGAQSPASRRGRVELRSTWKGYGEQFRRLIDHLPADRLPALAAILDKLIAEDDVIIANEEITKYRKIQQEMNGITIIVSK